MYDISEAEYLEGNYPDARRDHEIALITSIIASYPQAEEAAEEIWLFMNGNPDCIGLDQ